MTDGGRGEPPTTSSGGGAPPCILLTTGCGKYGNGCVGAPCVAPPPPGTVITTTTTSTSTQTSRKKSCGGITGWLECHWESIVTVVTVVVVVTIAVVAVAGCIAGSGVTLGVAALVCAPVIGAAAAATCGLVMGDCGGGGDDSSDASGDGTTDGTGDGTSTTNTTAPTTADPQAAAGSTSDGQTGSSGPSTGTEGTTGKGSNPVANSDTKDSGTGSGSGGGSGTSGTCSFAPSTLVLMAGGKTEPISKIKTGDKVESADPSTGKEQGTRPVTATWINHDTDLVDLTIDTGHGTTAVLHTTAEHPFWDPKSHTWVPAGQLKPGEALTTADGHQVHVKTVKKTPGAANRYNLTVQQLHTYYVLAGTTPILVHNTCGPDIDYGKIDSTGRRSGIVAIVTPSMLGTGGKAVQRMSKNLPGFISGDNGDTRGHLLPKDLGGSGTTPENFVRTTSAIDNGPMNTFEQEIAAYVRGDGSGGNTIMYAATPHYRPGENVAFAVSIEAFDDTGWFVGKTFFQ